MIPPSPDDDLTYFPYTAPARRDKALHTLQGILEGLAMDGVVNLLEHRELEAWLRQYESLATRDSAFSELITRIHLAMADGKLEPDEIADISNWVERLDPASCYYDPLTHRIQELHGMLHGIIADGIINRSELDGLQQWLDDVGEYRKYWPIGEVESAVMAVLKDGKITPEEHQFLLRYFASFAGISPTTRKDLPVVSMRELRLDGVCAVDPEIEFADHSFCFTGTSEKYARSQLVDLVHTRGGLFTPAVRQDLNFLVVCDDGNPCWAFASYGRKIEKAIGYRKTGCAIVIVREADFLDAALN